MSLASLNLAVAADQGRKMLVLHPVDRIPLKGADKEPVFITLLGKDSDVFIAAEQAMRNEAVEAARQGKKFSAAQSDAAAGDALARCVTGWGNIPAAWLTEGGTEEEPVEFSPAAAKALFANRGVRWLRDQADAFVGERADFLKA